MKQHGAFLMLILSSCKTLSFLKCSKKLSQLLPLARVGAVEELFQRHESKIA